MISVFHTHEGVAKQHVFGDETHGVIAVTTQAFKRKIKRQNGLPVMVGIITVAQNHINKLG